MVLDFEFGGDDYHQGEHFEYEVDRDQIMEAIADHCADGFIAYIIRTYKCDETKRNSLYKQKKHIRSIFYWMINEYDLFYDEDSETDWIDVIKEYWEEEASEQWCESKY